eukprot:191438_1
MGGSRWINNPGCSNRLQIKATLPKNPPGAVYRAEFAVGDSSHSWEQQHHFPLDSFGVVYIDFDTYCPTRVRIAILYKGKKYLTQPRTVPMVPIPVSMLVPKSFNTKWSTLPRKRHWLDYETNLPPTNPPETVYTAQYTPRNNPDAWLESSRRFDKDGRASVAFKLDQQPLKARICLAYGGAYWWTDPQDVPSSIVRPQYQLSAIWSPNPWDKMLIIKATLPEIQGTEVYYPSFLMP